MNVIVFDIGGTLMEYVNMPNVWIDYYDSAFRHVREKLGLPLTDEQLEASIEVLKQYNPRVKYRERDYAPEQIFGDAAEGWDFPYSLEEVISAPPASTSGRPTCHALWRGVFSALRR